MRGAGMRRRGFIGCCIKKVKGVFKKLVEKVYGEWF